jgi:hypothetical protein
MIYDGYTQKASESPSGNVRVTIADGTGATSTEPEADLAAVTAHELYGHALPIAQGQPGEHETNPDGTYNPNGSVNRNTDKLELDTKELY